jgi:hypothetical protein
MTCEQAKAEAIRQSHRRWALARSRGRRRFVWVHGVLAWGGLLALGLVLGQFIAGRFHPVGALATIALCAAGGYLIGAVKWRHNEEAYRIGRGEEIA